MNSFALLNQVLIIFFIMLVGVYAKKRNIINEKMNKDLTIVLLNLSIPLNIIASFNFDYSKEMLLNMLIVLIFGVLLHPVCYFVGKILFFKFKGEDKTILTFSIIFSNCGFMAFPILDSIYGKTGILYGSIFVATFNIYIWSLGVKLFSKDTYTFKIKNIFNPGIVSVFIGFLLFIFSIKLPFPIQRCFELIGATTTPLSMIITGVIVADMNVKKLFTTKSVYYVALIRLLLIPIISSIILKFFGITDIVLGVCVLIAAMPVAAMCTVFAERFDGNYELASQNVFITTILSLITIPLIAFFIL